MRYILDTHTFLWFIWGDIKLSSTAREIISETNNDIFLSMASLWEMTIKNGTGKLDLSRDISSFFQDRVDANNFLILPIHRFHLVTLSTLPLYHRDPFDRLLIAQSISENIPIISADTAFDAYPVTRIW